MKTFNFYETINDFVISNDVIRMFSDIISIKYKRSYYYLVDGQKKYIEESVLENSSDNSVFELKDPDYEWDESNGVNLELSLDISNTKYLFGNYGIVYGDSKIGIGIEWKPEKSRIKKCVKIGSFDKDSNNIYFNKDIALMDLNSNINFTLLFYIDREGQNEGLSTFANKKGLIICRIDFFTLKFGGVASTFPVVETSQVGGPLWKVVLNYDDIYDDEFTEETVKIILNKAHKAFGYLQENGTDYNPAFLSEVMSSAVSTMLAQIIANENGNIDFKKAYSDGSIAQALNYFKTTLNFNISNNYFELYESVKKYFDKEFK